MEGASLVFFGLVVLMRWLVIGLLVSLAALLIAAGALLRHVLWQRRIAHGTLSDASAAPGDSDGQPPPAPPLDTGPES